MVNSYLKVSICKKRVIVYKRARPPIGAFYIRSVILWALFRAAAFATGFLVFASVAYVLRLLFQ